MEYESNRPTYRLLREMLSPLVDKDDDMALSMYLGLILSGKDMESREESESPCGGRYAFHMLFNEVLRNLMKEEGMSKEDVCDVLNWEIAELNLKASAYTFALGALMDSEESDD